MSYFFLPKYDHKEAVWSMFYDRYIEKDEVKESGGDQTDIWKQAMILFKNQHYEESKKYYEMYIAAQPNNIDAQGQYVSVSFVITKDCIATTNQLFPCFC